MVAKFFFSVVQLFAAALLLSSCNGAASKQSNNKQLQKGERKIVLLDNFFNNEYKTINGEKVKWHYLWSDTSMGGYSELGKLFQEEGAVLQTLEEAPTIENLKNASIYIIADPDDKREADEPNYMTEEYANAILNWVKAGGVLVMLANDSANCELDQFNILSQKFGIIFNKDNRLVVQDPHFEQGEVKINPGNPIFKTAKNIYIKGICSVSAVSPGEIVLKTEELNIMAIAKSGKGTVFALGDPWIYNEYIGHRRLPQHFENHKAAVDWVKWLMISASENE